MRGEARAAVRNNAEWCDALCRSHGLPGGTFGARVWTHPVRTPPYYPDAVTLDPDATADEVLAGVDRSAPGCSVKDSFGTLDLTPYGFRPLFTASWLHRPAGPPQPGPVGARWREVRTPGELAAWERAWNGGAPAGLFRPALLADPATTVLAGHDPDGGGVMAGAVVSEAAGVLGVSNLFGPAGSRTGCLAALADRRPELPVVGYEHGEDLADALHHGFTAVGPLRIWAAP
ncbi:hypothetical protein NX801_21630 [Streptomyces sp. LP05-1]|uniref:Uncharacterized protein n=1 Tax=Streptomyces pyxinae TaxID=2970734 RepID=A0ABT2CL99_9ACTN|nr:hypothetical protein [Streptomyces sp. LP05-1]MCS0638208.1 hypothetical protein [Streptomyces sp. LP05-1]